MIMSNKGMIMVTSEGSDQALVADFAGLIRGMCTKNSTRDKLIIPKDMLVALTGAIVYNDIDIINTINVKLLKEKTIKPKEAKMYLKIFEDITEAEMESQIHE